MKLKQEIQNKYKQEIFNALDKGQIGGDAGAIIGGVVGAVIGFFVGGIQGAISGFMIGSAIGGLFSSTDADEMSGGTVGLGGPQSPRYGFGALSNTFTNEIPVPVLYGQLKLAGNCIYQSDPAEVIYRCLGLTEGEIQQITDVKVNDIAISTLTGCSYTAYLGTSTQTVDSRFLSEVDGLRYLAYLAVTLQTSDQLKGGNPTITCEVQGMKVSTWSGSAWTTAKTFSRNPAACLRDFLTNSRYGGGIAEAAIDASSWGSVYEYCEAQITTIGGDSTEARAYLDYIIDGRKPLLDAINSILATFSGFLVFSGNKIKLKVETEEAVSQAFDMSNIIKGSFTYSEVSKDDIPNRVKVQYIDPEYNYTKIFAQADDPLDQEDRSELGLGEDIVMQEISLLGITRYSQAARQANVFLRLAQACSIYCTFGVSSDALAAEVGDVISVTHDVSKWSAKEFRILAIEATKDDNLKLYCREYDDSIYSGYASGYLTPDYGDVVDESTPPNPPGNFTVIQNLSGIQFAWEAPADIFGVGVASFEIRRGSNWDTATVIVTDIASNIRSYTSTTEYIGTTAYLIKSYSSFGIYSTLPARDCIATTIPVPYDPVYEHDEFTRLAGSSTSGLRREWTTNYSTDYFRKTIAVDNSTAQHQWDETSEVWDNSNIDYDEGPYETSEQTYTCEEIDLGSNCIASMQVSHTIKVNLGGGVVLIEWRYKVDGGAYGSYETFAPNSFAFRYCQFRIKMTVVNSFYTMKLIKFIVSAYITDVTETGSASIVDASNGYSVVFTQNYAATPKIALFSNGMSDYEPRISSMSSTGFIAKLYDTENDVNKTGDIDYFIAGY